MKKPYKLIEAHFYTSLHYFWIVCFYIVNIDLIVSKENFPCIACNEEAVGPFHKNILEVNVLFFFLCLLNSLHGLLLNFRHL